METGYNGYKNYATWNVALWIQNKEGYYNLAKFYKHFGYNSFVGNLLILYTDVKCTPDGISWCDPKLDIDELDKLIEGLE